MSEEKKRLGWMVDTDTQERLELVKVGVGRYVGDRRVMVAMTEIGSYALLVMTPDENGELREQQMHLSELDLASLLHGIFRYFDSAGEKLSALIFRSLDEESGYLYKSVDDLKEDKEGDGL